MKNVAYQSQLQVRLKPAEQDLVTGRDFEAVEERGKGVVCQAPSCQTEAPSPGELGCEQRRLMPESGKAIAEWRMCGPLHEKRIAVNGSRVRTRTRQARRFGALGINL